MWDEMQQDWEHFALESQAAVDMTAGRTSYAVEQVASHIIPWHADQHNRLNPRNGLCLSALHDKAFDQGLFTLTNDFRIEVFSEVKARMYNRFTTEWLVELDGRAIELPEKFSPANDFIDWHRENAFLGG